MSRRPPPSDAVIDTRDGAVVCPRCGKRETLPLPMAIAAMQHWLAYHAEQHRHCRPAPKVAPA